MQTKPTNIPQDACWNEETNQWIHGSIVEKTNRRAGLWLFWYPDGILECECNYDIEGELHGWFKTYHPNASIAVEGVYDHGSCHGLYSYYRADISTKYIFHEQIPLVIYKMIVEFKNNQPTNYRYFLKNGEEVDLEGKPKVYVTEMPKPTNIPQEAWWNAQDNEWALGQYNKQGLKINAWQWWYPDGTKVCESNFNERGQLHGQFKRYHPDGTVSQEGTYENGLANGWLTYYRSENDTSEKGMTPFNKKIWSKKVRWENGIQKESRAFLKDGTEVDEHAKPITWIPEPIKPSHIPTTARWFVENKNDKTLGKWVDGQYKNGNFLGTWYWWYMNGNLATEENYNDKGELYGICKYYYKDDGILRQEGNYVNGALQGELKIYNADGSLQELKNYLEGKLNGIYKQYDNDILQKEQNYKMGELDGEYRKYSKKGMLKEEGTYIDGFPHKKYLSQEIELINSILPFVNNEVDKEIISNKKPGLLNRIKLYTYLIDEQTFKRNIELSLNILNRQPENELAEIIIEKASYQFPELLYEHLELIYELQIFGKMYNDSYPWRNSKKKNFEFLKKIFFDKNRETEYYDIFKRMIETRDIEVIQYAIKSVYENEEIFKKCLWEKENVDGFINRHLEYINLYRENNKIISLSYNEKPYHIIFLNNYFDKEDYTSKYPTWKLTPEKDEVQYKFGGLLDNKLQHIITFDPVPASLNIKSLSKLILAANLDLPCELFYIHDENGYPKPLKQDEAKNIDLEYTIKETIVLLAPTPNRWHFQDDTGINNLFRIGGEPTWIQGPENPTCPKCGKKMKFLMQLNEGLPTIDSNFSLGFGDSGMCYIFWCDESRVSGYFYQCY